LRLRSRFCVMGGRRTRLKAEKKRQHDRERVRLKRNNPEELEKVRKMSQDSRKRKKTEHQRLTDELQYWKGQAMKWMKIALQHQPKDCNQVLDNQDLSLDPPKHESSTFMSFPITQAPASTLTLASALTPAPASLPTSASASISILAPVSVPLMSASPLSAPSVSAPPSAPLSVLLAIPLSALPSTLPSTPHSQISSNTIRPSFSIDEFDDITFRSIALTLVSIFKAEGMTKTDARSKVASLCNVSQRTLLRWERSYSKAHQILGKQHGGGFDSVFENEEVLRKAREWCKGQKGKGLTAQLFLAEWIQKNEETRHIRNIKSARRLLHRIGYRYGSSSPGVYMDGHERDDVVQSRREFCQKISELEKMSDIVFIAQDESVYHAKDGISKEWIDKNTNLKKKGKGKGIMVSGWFDHEGPLVVDGEASYFLLKFGQEWGYYSWEKFEKDLMKAITIAEAKYPGKHLVFLYDQSSIHKKRSDDALDAKRLNLKPGGKQPRMRETVWNGVRQSLVFPPDHPDHPNQPKGAKALAIERGIDIHGLKKDEIIARLAECADFQNETPLLTKIHEAKGHTCLFLPKFHCEFNWAELIWACSKRYCRKNCKGNINALETNILASFPTISPTTYLKIFQHAMEEIDLASSDTSTPKTHKIYKSHRTQNGGQIPWQHILDLADLSSSQSSPLTPHTI
jgi:hypothetical protein